jgi:(p)ppGpp synthase/HD superfamily hydrolase
MAYGARTRASDGSTFLDHATEVATLLRDAGFDDELVAAGFLHDSVEHGTLSEEGLRDEVGDEICAVVMTLTEDAGIEDYAERKRALRDQVAAAGGRALTVFAADKLTVVLALSGPLEASVADHYRESLAVIEAGAPQSVFLPMLRAELESLSEESGPRRDTGREWKRAQRAQLTG